MGPEATNVICSDSSADNEWAWIACSTFHPYNEKNSLNVGQAVGKSGSEDGRGKAASHPFVSS